MVDEGWSENFSSPSNNRSKPIYSEHDLKMTSLSLGWAMLICCGIGLVGNVLSIKIFSHRSMRSSVNVLLTGLSGIDFFMLLLVIPVFVLPCLNAYYVKPSVAEALPYITAYMYPFTLMAQSSSVWTFVAITVERWLAVCRPLKAISICTIGNAKKALIIIYISAIVYNLVRFGEYKLETFSLEPRSSNVSVHYVVDSSPGLRANWYYNWIYFISLYLITHFVVPFSILLIFNFLMIFAILKAKAKRKHLSRKEITEYKTTVMMCVIVLVFLLCNSLPMILNVLEAFYPNLFLDPHTMVIGYMLNDICNLLVVINSTINFITYSVFSQKYRNLLKAFINRTSHLTRLNTERYGSETGCALLESKYELGDSTDSSSRRYSRLLQRRMAFSCHGKLSKGSIYNARIQSRHNLTTGSNFIEKNLKKQNL